MVSLFDKANQASKSPNKIMTIKHHEFLKRIKKTLYYGPSNPDRMISQPLAQHVTAHFNNTHKNYDLNILDLQTVSKIRQQTPCSMILSMIYLERLLKYDPSYARLISPSELFLVTLMVSTKFYSDYDETEVFINNWAYEGDISMERLKQLEISFLNAIQWNLLVSDNEFFEKLKTVETLLAQKEGLTRSWYTYTELELLMPKIEIAKQIIHYTSVLMFTYACSILTIALSSIILTSVPISQELSTTTNITTDSIVPKALPNDVMIHIDSNNQTECIFDLDDELIFEEEELDGRKCCNFTSVDFPLANNFNNKLVTNSYEPNYFGLFGKSRVVW